MARKILLVDDEPLILKGLKYSLEQDGYQTDFAMDGEVALTMSMYLMRVFGATEEQMVREGRRIRAELDGPSPETAERTGL